MEWDDQLRLLSSVTFAGEPAGLPKSTGTQMFESLEADDILFMDSSHVIRPRRHVVFEYLEVLPAG